jgi:hypothetical protein
LHRLEVFGGVLLRIRGAAHRYFDRECRSGGKLSQQLAQWQGALSGREATGSSLLDDGFLCCGSLCYCIT